MKKYLCIPCGYIYDPELGDEDGGIAPGTAFENLSDDWFCPICFAGKEDFEEIEEQKNFAICRPAADLAAGLCDVGSM